MTNWRDFIDVDRSVLAGKPKIKGTRISVELLISRLADGWSEEDILVSYPHLTKESMKAVHAYVLEIVQDGMLYLPIAKEAA